jgi:hypothetical protein
MEQIKIIGGFTDIRDELFRKTNMSSKGKTLEELKLWFTFANDLLCVHDSSDHAENITLALYIKKENRWRVFLNPGSRGEQLVSWLIHKTELRNIQNEFNSQYNSHGRFPFSRF